jgi:hypothetical protein
MLIVYIGAELAGDLMLKHLAFTEKHQCMQAFRMAGFLQVPACLARVTAIKYNALACFVVAIVSHNSMQICRICNTVS